MKKIDIELIKKYVAGENIENYNLEELENDSAFMLAVINYSNDINIYNLCSENVKNDYNFVKQVILKFKNKKDFIIKIADYYLKNNENDFECIELNIIMSKLMNNRENPKYKILSDTNYFAKRLEIEAEKSRDKEVALSAGMGFIFLFDLYHSSEIITEYYAELMMKEIIKDNDIDFENMIHNHFKSREQIENIGINNYIIRVISYYDSMLGSYLSTHLNLIASMKEQIKNACANWDNYILQNEKERYMNMFDMVHTYLNSVESKMGETDIIYYIASELGIVDKVAQYDCIDVLNFDLDLDIVNDMIRFEIEHSLKEKLVYLKIRKIMKNQLFSSKPLNLDELLKEEKRIESKGSSKTKM